MMMSILRVIGLACCLLILLGATAAVLAALYWLMHELHKNTYHPHRRKEDH